MIDTALPKKREWVGKLCNHCGSTNTVYEVYDYGKEKYCLSCNRPDTF